MLTDAPHNHDDAFGVSDGDECQDVRWEKIDY